MAIIRRGDLNRPLTIDEMDGNFTYLEELAGTGGGTAIGGTAIDGLQDQIDLINATFSNLDLQFVTDNGSTITNQIVIVDNNISIRDGSDETNVLITQGEIAVTDPYTSDGTNILPARIDITKNNKSTSFIPNAGITASNVISLPTKSGTLALTSDIVGGGETASYLSYKALLTQTGTNAPTANIKYNTLGYDPVIVRESTGNYSLSLTGNVIGKIIVMLGGHVLAYDTRVVYSIQYNPKTTTTNILIYSGSNYVGTLSDDLLVDTPITIELYPT